MRYSGFEPNPMTKNRTVLRDRHARSFGLFCRQLCSLGISKYCCRKLRLRTYLNCFVTHQYVGKYILNKKWAPPPVREIFRYGALAMNSLRGGHQAKIFRSKHLLRLRPPHEQFRTGRSQFRVQSLPGACTKEGQIISSFYPLDTAKVHTRRSDYLTAIHQSWCRDKECATTKILIWLRYATNQREVILGHR